MMAGSAHLTCGWHVFFLIIHIALSNGSDDQFGTDCNKRNTCGKSPSVNSTKMNCYCQQSCTVFDDCCVDAEVSDNGLSQHEIESIRARVACMPLNYIASLAPIYFMRNCSSSYPKGYIRDRCESFMDALPLNKSNLQKDPYVFVPVTSTVTGLLFVNVFCALCNNEEKYTFWNVSYVHEKDRDESMLKNITELSDYLEAFPSDRIDMTHSAQMYHVCKDESRVIDSCPDGWTDNTERKLCAGPVLYVYHDVKAYRNIHCAKCHGLTADEVSCVDPKWQLGSSDIRPPGSFSLLLDFNAGGGQFVSGSVGKTIPSNAESCEQGHLWDPFKLQCIYLLCPEGQVFIGDGCSEDGNTGAVVDPDITTCPLIRLNFSDFEIDSDKNMIVHIYNLTLDPGDYFLNSTHAYICVPDMFFPLIKFDAIQGYLTIVGNIISIISLFIMLAVYSWYPALRNTPGIALMCLACALIMGQLLFTVGIQGIGPYELCYCISLGIHFGFLSYFFWMNVVAFDIWNTFTASLHDISHSGRVRYKRLTAYTLYAWGIPALLIAISIILDNTSGNHVHPDYATYLCFLNDRMRLLVLFAIPLAVVLLLDIVFFVWTVVIIRKVSRDSRKARRNCPDTTQFFLFVKLAFVMGLTWITGFIAALSQVEALWYIFILLNSFQVLFYIAPNYKHRFSSALPGTDTEIFFRNSRDLWTETVDATLMHNYVFL